MPQFARSCLLIAEVALAGGAFSAGCKPAVTAPTIYDVATVSASPSNSITMNVGQHSIVTIHLSNKNGHFLPASGADAIPISTDFGDAQTVSVSETNNLSDQDRNFVVTCLKPGTTALTFTVGVKSVTVTVTCNGPTPSISGLTPGSATIYGPNTLLNVTGGGFLPNSVIRFNGADLTTSFDDANHLHGTITPTILGTTAGNKDVTVFNPPPGGGLSSAFPFVANNPVPAVSGTAPATLNAGVYPNANITVNGSGFVVNSTIKWNDGTVVTTFGSQNTLSASIPSSGLLTAGTGQITVVNGPPGGGTSGAQPVTVLQAPQVWIVDYNLPVQTGVVPNGTYIQTMLSTDQVPVGTIQLSTDGPEGTHFRGQNPDRIGWSGSSGWIFDLSSATANGLPYHFVSWHQCILNTTLNAGNPVNIEQLNGTGAVIATTPVTALLPCPDIVLNAATVKIRMRMTGAGTSADANTFVGSR